MAKNDILLLDQLVEESSHLGARGVGDAFERFAIGEVLKDEDLTADELELGVVDGRNDGGVDGWYLFVDGEYVSDPDAFEATHEVSNIQLYIFTAKHHATFAQEPVNSLATTLPTILDLTSDEDTLRALFNDELLACRETLKTILLITAKHGPKVSIEIMYLSRGDSTNVGREVRARSDALKQELATFFSNSTVTFSYCGASEIISFSRKLKRFSSVLIFEEAPVSRDTDNYVGLVSLPCYVDFVKDEDGTLRRYLFESNVRDFMGTTYVNNSILRTLRENGDNAAKDFWWLNNGVTVIADKATLVGKQLHLENVQIVNGLQTTETVFDYFKSASDTDTRCILVKVLVAPDKTLADSIILATNNQNKVNLSSLRATDTIQRNIEDLLLSDGWFYDRRRNYYLNHGKPRSRIVSMSYMSWAVASLLLGEPSTANRSRPKLLQKENKYRRVFSDKYDLRVYSSALKICKDIERSMLKLQFCDDPYHVRVYATMFRFLYAHLYCVGIAKCATRTPQQIIEIATGAINEQGIEEVHKLVIAARESLRKDGRNMRKLHRNREFQEQLTKIVLDESDG